MAERRGDEGIASGENQKMIKARFVLGLARGAGGSCCALGGGVVFLASQGNTLSSPGQGLGGTTKGGDFVDVQSAAGTAAATTFVLSSPQMALDVQQWAGNSASNFGWILVGQEDLAGAADRLDSRENTNPNDRPMLIIDYSMPA